MVTGFIDGDKAHGRPVDVGIDGTGALLVADDAGNMVWRVAAADGSVTPEPVGTDPVAAAASGGVPAQSGAAAPASAGAAAPAGQGGQAGTIPATPQQPTTTAQQPGGETPPASADEQLTGQEPAAPSSGSAGAPSPSPLQVAPAVIPGGAEQGSSPRQGQ